MSSDKFHCTNGHCLTDCVLSSIDYDGDLPPRICPHSGIEVYWQKYKNKPTVFHRITASPEVLAPYFVFSTDGLYYSSLTGTFYKYQGRAIEATVERLKEVGE